MAAPEPTQRRGKNLRGLDLDSFSYMEPVLYYSDALTLKHLNPLFSPLEEEYEEEEDEYGADEGAEDTNLTSDSKDIPVLSKDFKPAGKKEERKRTRALVYFSKSNPKSQRSKSSPINSPKGS